VVNIPVDLSLMALLKLSSNASVRFLHIPKCGGQTFNYVLARNYNRKRTFAFSGDEKGDLLRYQAYLAVAVQAQQPIQLFRGHAPLFTGIQEADDAIIITLFRDPISRAKSFCQHVYEGKSAHLVDRFPPDTFNLDAFLDSGVEELSNLQTKMLINTGSCHASTKIETMGETAAVKLAIGNLEKHVTIFGLVERYDESLIHFADHLGWALPVYARKNSKSQTQRLKFESRHLSKLEALNGADRLLYEQVKKLYEERYKLGPRQIRRLRLQQLINRRILPHWEAFRLKCILTMRSVKK